MLEAAHSTFNAARPKRLPAPPVPLRLSNSGPERNRFPKTAPKAQAQPARTEAKFHATEEDDYVETYW